MEYLVYPIKNNELQKVEEFKSLIEALPIHIMFVRDDISYKAAEIRAHYPQIKPIDALHLATACECNCDVFFTNDKQLRQFEEIECLMVDDMVQEKNTEF